MKFSLLPTLYSLLPFFLLSLLYLLYHTHFIDVIDMRTVWGDHPYTNSIFVRVMTFFSLLPQYLWLLVFPKDLFYEHDFAMTIPTSPWQLPGFITVAIISTVGFLLLYELLKRNKQLTTDNIQLTCFLFISFFVSFLPFTGLVLINGIMYEHFLYIPMIFFFAFLVVISNLLIKKSLIITHYSLIIIFLLLIVRSWSRQYEWQDPIRLYTQTLRYAPNSFRVRNNLAMAYEEHGQLEEAIAEYNTVITLSPHIPNPYHNLGNLYMSRQQFDLAEQYFIKAIELDPYFGYSYASLLTLYHATKQQEKHDAIAKEVEKRFEVPPSSP